MGNIPHTKNVENIGKVERVASVVGGGLLAWYGLKRGRTAGYAIAAIGGDLLRRGATGHSFAYQALGVRTAPNSGANISIPYELGIRVDRVITINKSREEVYRFWRQFENLPGFMCHLESVKDLGGSRSHWVAKAPAGKTVEWDAEVINEKENELIGWRSLDGSDVQQAGSVQFKDAPGGRGTQVRIALQYNPPGGAIGAALAKLWGEDPEWQIADDLRRLKALLETGEVPSTGKQPAVIKKQHKSKRRHDAVRAASEESFPASDSPAWNVEL